MEIVDLFLNALQSKISACNNQITNYENSKNQRLQFKNILYVHGILNDEIKLEDLVSFNDEEIKILFACLDDEKKDLLFKTYNVYKPLFEMYNKIKDKYEGNFEAPQYNEASKWLNDIVSKVNRYLKSIKDINSEYVDSLREENQLYTKYYNLFNGNELIRPIENLKEFNNLLNTLIFNNHEKYEIKKFIGISHIRLLSKEYNNSMADDLDKYKVIIKGKKEKYHEIYNMLLSEKDINMESDTGALAKKINKDEYDIIEALSVIFMEQVLDDVKEDKLKVSEAILKLEDIILYSNKVKKDDNELNSVDNSIVQEAKNILHNEKELVNSINEEEFGKYLAQSMNEENDESIKYQIVSILLALHGELEKYENAKDMEKVGNLVLNNIKEYIEAYQTLKNKSNK